MAVALGITVVCMVLGSSSVAALVGPGKKLRWAALLILAVLAVAAAVRARPVKSDRPFRLVAWLGASFATLAVLSTGWSVDPRLTGGRAVSFAVLMVTAGALAFAAHANPKLPERLLYGALAGTCAAALAGVLMLLVARSDAIEPASTWYPARFKGLGENADTLSMLEGMVFPVALWGLVQARTRGRQLLHLAAIVLLLASISASGSRGGLVAAFVGGIALSLTAPSTWRGRLALSAAVCAALFAATAGTQIPKPLVAQQSAQSPGAGSSGLVTTPSRTIGPPDRYTGRLTDELYRNAGEQRSLWSSSGRLEAWHGAIQQADARPLLGYGFGTENVVFIDRVQNFDGSYIENSVIGVYLQLGAIGLVSFLAVLLVACATAVRLVRRADAASPAPALVAVVAGGLVLMGVQSYVYSVGNVATVSFWVAAFLLAVVPPAGRWHVTSPGRQQREGAVAAA